MVAAWDDRLKVPRGGETIADDWPRNAPPPPAVEADVKERDGISGFAAYAWDAVAVQDCGFGPHPDSVQWGRTGSRVKRTIFATVDDASMADTDGSAVPESHDSVASLADACRQGRRSGRRIDVCEFEEVCFCDVIGGTDGNLIDIIIGVTDAIAVSMTKDYNMALIKLVRGIGPLRAFCLCTKAMNSGIGKAQYWLWSRALCFACRCANLDWCIANPGDARKMCVDALQAASKTNDVCSDSAEELRSSVAEMVENAKGAVGLSFVDFVKHHRAAPKEVGIRLEVVTDTVQTRVRPKPVKKVDKSNGGPARRKARMAGRPRTAKIAKDFCKERAKPKPRKVTKDKAKSRTKGRPSKAAGWSCKTCGSSFHNRAAYRVHRIGGGCGKGKRTFKGRQAVKAPDGSVRRSAVAGNEDGPAHKTACGSSISADGQRGDANCGGVYCSSSADSTRREVAEKAGRTSEQSGAFAALPVKKRRKQSRTEAEAKGGA